MTRTDDPTREALRLGWALVYLLALVAVIVTLGPVVYGALGGFRSNEQLAQRPLRAAGPVGVLQLLPRC